jgi:hypothetical protein
MGLGSAARGAGGIAACGTSESGFLLPHIGPPRWLIPRLPSRGSSNSTVTGFRDACQQLYSGVPKQGNRLCGRLFVGVTYLSQKCTYGDWEPRFQVPRSIFFSRAGDALRQVRQLGGQAGKKKRRLGANPSASSTDRSRVRVPQGSPPSREHPRCFNYRTIYPRAVNQEKFLPTIIQYDWVWRLAGHATLLDSSDCYVHEIRQNGVWSCRLKERRRMRAPGFIERAPFIARGSIYCTGSK